MDFLEWIAWATRLTLVAVIAWVWKMNSRQAVIEERQEAAREARAEIRTQLTSFVPRGEIMARLDGIEDQLRDIKDIIKKLRNGQ